MKNKLLTISTITVLLLAGQSAIANSDTSDNDFTPFDPQAINQVKDNRLYAAPAATSNDADLMKASTLNSRVQGDNGFYYVESEDPFSLNHSSDQ